MGSNPIVSATYTNFINIFSILRVLIRPCCTQGCTQKVYPLIRTKHRSPRPNLLQRVGKNGAAQRDFQQLAACFALLNQGQQRLKRTILNNSMIGLIDHKRFAGGLRCDDRALPGGSWPQEFILANPEKLGC